MNAYIDASVLLRVLFGEPEPLASWDAIDQGVASEIIRVEALRTLDRLRLQKDLDDREVSERRAAILAALGTLTLVPVHASILERAADPFPTALGTLDALHLATALAVRDEFPDLVLATHDARLALAATSMGFPVEGVAGAS